MKKISESEIANSAENWTNIQQIFLAAILIWLPKYIRGRKRAQWKTTSMETTSMRDNLNGRQPQWKMILNGTQPQLKTTSFGRRAHLKDDLNGRRPQ